MATISLSGRQVVEVMKTECKVMMLDYYFSYHVPDEQTVRDYYKIWRLYASVRERDAFFQEHPEIMELVNDDF